MAFEEYNPIVLNHFLNPRNAGDLRQPTAVATVVNSVCGDTVKLSVRVDQGRIVEARTKTFGCAAAIACASVLTELLIGRTLEEARRIRNTDVVAKLGGLPDQKNKCSNVAQEAVAAVLNEIERSAGDPR